MSRLAIILAIGVIAAFAKALTPVCNAGTALTPIGPPIDLRQMPSGLFSGQLVGNELPDVVLPMVEATVFPVVGETTRILENEGDLQFTLSEPGILPEEAVLEAEIVFNTNVAGTRDARGAVVDLDQDGVNELVLAPGRVFRAIRESDGEIMFAEDLDAVPPYPCGNTVFRLHDMNDDGFADFVQAHEPPNIFYGFLGGALCPGGVVSATNRLFLNAQTGTFTDETDSLPGSLFPIFDATKQIIVADFNGDGLADLLTGNGWTGDVSGELFTPLPMELILGGRDDTFITSTSPHPTNDVYPILMREADVDGDGDVDFLLGHRIEVEDPDPLIIEYSLYQELRIYFNRGDGTFDFELLRAGGQEDKLAFTNNASFADFDGDGDPDLLLAGRAILENDGNGAFQQTTNLELHLPDEIDSLEDIAIDDFDGHGDPDIAATAFASDGTTPLLFFFENAAQSSADIDGDGVVDFADLLQLLAAWGPCAPESACPADLDRDGQIGFADLLELLANWS